jgi:hypothetical protein
VAFVGLPWEIPQDRSYDGHITPRSTATETGLAVPRMGDDVPAVFDCYAAVNASQRARPATTVSDSGHRPIQAVGVARYVVQQPTVERILPRYGQPRPHNREGHITGVMWSTT